MKYKKYCRVRDHCRYTEEYRVAADSIYNLRIKCTYKNSYSFS